MASVDIKTLKEIKDKSPEAYKKIVFNFNSAATLEQAIEYLSGSPKISHAYHLPKIIEELLKKNVEDPYTLNKIIDNTYYDYSYDKQKAIQEFQNKTGNKFVENKEKTKDMVFEVKQIVDSLKDKNAMNVTHIKVKNINYFICFYNDGYDIYFIDSRNGNENLLKSIAKRYLDLIDFNHIYLRHLFKNFNNLNL